MSKIRRFEEEEAYVAQGICTGEGIAAKVTKEVENPVDLETVEYCRPCLPEGGVRRIDARYFWMSVPAKMNSCSERMRTVNLYSPDCNDDDGFRLA